MEKKSRKSARIELTPEPKKQPREEQAGDANDRVELKLDELEERVTPRRIGTFF